MYNKNYRAMQVYYLIKEVIRVFNVDYKFYGKLYWSLTTLTLDGHRYTSVSYKQVIATMCLP